MKGNFSWLRTAVSILLLSFLGISPASALTNTDIANAIYKGQFLAPGSSVNVRMDKDQVLVSTFKHSNDDKDCKIDAALISKAVFDLNPEGLARVTCYFYGRDMSAGYQEVSVSAGDIKAFASGSLTKEQLLASMNVKTVSTQSTSDRIARQLESNWISRPTDYLINEDKDSVTINTALDSWVTDDDSKLEALRIAVNAINTQPTAQKITIVFTDPTARIENREISFTPASIESIWKPIQTSLASVSVTKKAATIELAALKANPGPLQAERESVLARLRDMEKKGIGVLPFVKVYFGIEQAIKAGGDAKTLAESLRLLNQSIDDQLKRSASAKDKPKPAAQAPAAAEVDVEALKKLIQPPLEKWAFGRQPIFVEDVLKNTNKVIQIQEQACTGGGVNPEKDIKFSNGLFEVARVLALVGRRPEAEKLHARATAIRTKIKQ